MIFCTYELPEQTNCRRNAERVSVCNRIRMERFQRQLFFVQNAPAVHPLAQPSFKTTAKYCFGLIPERVFEAIKMAIVAEAAMLICLGNRKAAQDGCFSFEDG